MTRKTKWLAPGTSHTVEHTMEPHITTLEGEVRTVYSLCKATKPNNSNEINCPCGALRYVWSNAPVERFELFTPCAVGTCNTPKPTDSGYPKDGRTLEEVKTLGWQIYQNWGWVCPRHVHICGPGCYDIVDAGCCGDHPDCIYDYDDNSHECGESCFDEDCGYLDMGAGEDQTSVSGTFEGETTFEAALRPRTCYHVCVQCL